MARTIGNPLSWTAQILGIGSHHIGEGTRELGGEDTAPIELKRIDTSDLAQALRDGLEDFMAMRTDVLFIVLIYPILGIFLTWIALDRALLPMVFPLATGFALVGPAAAIGLYEMSRKREEEGHASWSDAFGVATSRSIVPILMLVVYLGAIFGVWLFAAWLIYNVTLGPGAPASAAALVTDTFTTSAGWTMLVLGVAIGGVFATLALAISLVSFPLLLDRHVGLPRAVVTSIRITLRNPVTVALWGAIVAGLLAVGMLTFFIGLIVILPVLGHATWHLYRAAVAPSPEKSSAQN